MNMRMFGVFRAVKAVSTAVFALACICWASAGSGSAPSHPTLIRASAPLGPTPTPTPDCSAVWTMVPSPNPSYPTSSYNRLFGMTAISANDVWAVGSYGYGERGAALAIHWDGNKWLQFPSPSPGNLNNILIGVGALSSDDVWAVGYQDIGIPGTFTLIEHWDGNQWSVVPSPNILFRFNWLNSV